MPSVSEIVRQEEEEGQGNGATPQSLETRYVAAADKAARTRVTVARLERTLAALKQQLSNEEAASDGLLRELRGEPQKQKGPSPEETKRLEELLRQQRPVPVSPFMPPLPSFKYADDDDRGNRGPNGGEHF